MCSPNGNLLPFGGRSIILFLLKPISAPFFKIEIAYDYSLWVSVNVAVADADADLVII